MNRFNKVIILFLFIILVLSGAFWKVMQTDYVGMIISKEIARKVESEFNLDFAFKRIELGMFPPGIKIYDCSLKANTESGVKSVDVLIKEVGVYFGLINLFSNKIIIEKIKIYDGVINLVLTSIKNKSGRKIDISKINISKMLQKLIFTYLDRLPVILKKAEINKVQINSEKHHLWMESLNLSVGEDYIGLRAIIENIESSELNKINLEKIDSLDLDIEYFNNRLVVKKIIFHKEHEQYSFKGDIYRDERVGLSLSGIMNITGEMSDLLNRFKIGIDYKLYGDVNINVYVEDSIIDPQLKFSLDVYNLISPWVKLKRLKLKGGKTGDIIRVAEVNCSGDKGSLRLVNSFDAYNIRVKEMVQNKIIVEANNLHTNTALYVIRENLDILKGFMNGKVEIELTRDFKKLSFRPMEGFHVKNLLLTGKNDPIIINSKVYLTTGGFDVGLGEDGAVDINTIVKFKNSILPVKGRISKKILIDIVDGEIDLKELGPIAGFPLLGDGYIDLKIHGEGQKVFFDFDLDIANMVVSGLLLGRVVGRTRLNLKNLLLKTDVKNCKYKTIKYMVKGNIDIADQGNLDLSLKIEDGNSSDLREMLDPIFTGIDKDLSKLINFSFSANTSIKGRPEDSSLKIKSRIKGRNFQFYTEDMDKFVVNLEYNDNVIYLNKVIIRKHGAKLSGTFSYDMNNRFLEYEAKLRGLKLGDINIYSRLNLGYSGKLSGSILGSGQIGKMTTRNVLNLTDSYIGDLSVGGAFLNIYTKGAKIFINGNILGQTIILDSFVNLNGQVKGKRPAYINIDVKTHQVKEIAGIISKHNVSDSTLSGVLEAKIRVSFDISKLQEMSMLFDVSKMNITKAGRLYRIKPDRNKIIIQNGKIEKWDIVISSSADKIITMGEGVLGKKVNISCKYKINSNLIELLSNTIKKSQGKISGDFELIGEKKDYNLRMTSVGENIYIKLDKVPGVFDNLNFKIRVNNGVLTIDHFTSKYGGGNIQLWGGARFNVPYPIINIHGKFDNTYVSLMKRTSLLTSGSFKLSGVKAPYTLQSKISIVRGDVLDELDDLLKQKGEKVSYYDRFIPDLSRKKKFDLIEYKLVIKIIAPIIVRNAISDIRMDGYAEIKGSPDYPELSGELRIIPGASKLFFKGNEFSLNEGRMVLAGDNIGKKAEVNFIGHSKINEYDIRLNVNGKIDDINISFTSEPVLAREDILSLLALGFTTETSKNLQQSDRRAMTSVGLGSLLVEQLKINQSLNSSLGLKLSIMQEFEDTENSLVSGIGSGSDKSTTKIRSATKVKIKKKLGKKVNVSVSSVVGGSLGEKQDMNLNYNFNNNWSIQGIYEIKTDPEISSESSTSMGADLKLRLPF